MEIEFTFHSNNPKDCQLAKTIYEKGRAGNEFKCFIDEMEFSFILDQYKQGKVSTAWTLSRIDTARLVSVPNFEPDTKVVAAEESVKKAKEALQAAEDTLEKVKQE